MTLNTFTRVKKVDVLNTTNKYYYEKDQLGSITRITSSTGATVEEYTYNSFGETYRKNALGKFVLVNGTKSDIGNTRMFTGREYDREIMLYYNRARYYDANLGRFISQDPIGVADNVDLYSYVGNNPVNATDRMGTMKKLLGDENSVRIIYEEGVLGHVSIQIGKNIYTYRAKGGLFASRGRGIGSIVDPEYFTAEVGEISADELYLGKGSYNIYDIKASKEQVQELQTFVNKVKSSSNNRYGLLGVNCTTFVQAALSTAGISDDSSENVGGNIPDVYADSLLTLSKGENNYVTASHHYSFENMSRQEQNSTIDTYAENYGETSENMKIMSDSYMQSYVGQTFDFIKDTRNNIY